MLLIQNTALVISIDLVFNIFYIFVGYYRPNMERPPYDPVGHRHHMSNSIPPGPPHPGFRFSNSKLMCYSWNQTHVLVQFRVKIVNNSYSLI